MPQNLNAYTKKQAGFVTTWTEVATGTDNIEVTCTRAGESGRQHFITFLAVSTDAKLQNEGRGVEARLKSAGVTKFEMWPRSELQSTSFPEIVFGGIIPMKLAPPLFVEYDSDSGPWFAEFEAPIQMGENEAATFVSEMSGTKDKVTFTMGGFTSSNSVG
jgi:hypothetical protein